MISERFHSKETSKKPSKTAKIAPAQRKMTEIKRKKETDDAAEQARLICDTTKKRYSTIHNESLRTFATSFIHPILYHECRSLFPLLPLNDDRF
jgi:hypothetical protein